MAKTRQRSQYMTRLDLFTREFDSEDKLRRVLADLFRKMGHQGVRITHGATEKGKDIVFYATGPLGEHRLFACVVKNAPITGQADDTHHGAPTIVHSIQGVINQIQTAFAEPLTSATGSDQWIDTVYVMTPHECSTATMDSVKHQLQRSGQITFTCGQALLELFADFWPEFLWFETTVLTDYLSTLEKNLEEDYALAHLILRKAPLENIPGLSQVYVEPTFHRVLRTRGRIHIVAPNLKLLSGKHRKSDVEEEVRTAQTLWHILDTAAFWTNRNGRSTADDVTRISTEMNVLWEKAFKRYAAKTLGRFGAPSGDEYVCLDASPKFIEDATHVKARVDALLNDLQAQTNAANAFARTLAPALDAIRDEAFLTYTQTSDTARVIPFAFAPPITTRTLEFPETLIDDFEESLLITAPAGYGKTSFCRWHAIRDANRLVSKQAKILPVYVALHPLSSAQNMSPKDTFFPSLEVRKLLDVSPEERGFSRIRLYLDGLDEVTSEERQNEIMNLAEETIRTWTSVQVIVTGRDHVSGPWLRRLRRVRLSPLTEEKVQLLARNWLEPDRVEMFFRKLGEGGLRDLMKTPLLATLVLAVYRKTGTVPPNKTNLYATFTELLCGGWDFYKKVQRRQQSFGINDKTAILTRLASTLHLRERRDASESDFRTAVKETLPALASTYERLLEETLEEGLLTQAGNVLTYSHLSFQEYLAARALHDPAGLRPPQAATRYFMGNDWWKEVLAFYVTMTDRPAEMNEWIAKRALRSTSTVVDLYDRAIFLKEALLSAFPGYEEHKGAVPLYAQLKQKGERLAPSNS